MNILIKSKFLLLIGFLCTVSFAQAQVQTITGTVTDPNSLPLPGVYVIIKGQEKGTTTDFNGNYSIEATQGDILQFSYVGFSTQEATVGSSATINIVLQQSTQLDEVVVVGYGTQKKVNATGAVATIGNDILKDRPMTRLTEGLQGAVANLNISTNYGGGAPNATQSINIRGYTGLGSTSQGPLVVIDGVQGGDINALNPSDIKSISVIKDAAAAAIYGSSAPYGVILITTKRGEKGKMRITYNSTLTFNTPMGMPEMMNSLDHALLYNEASRHAGGADIFSQETINRIKLYQAGILKTETQASPDSDTWLYWGGANANNDWFDIFYKDVQLVQQHNLSISGGSEKTQYYVGLGYNNHPGMLKYGDDVYKRYNIRANIASQVNDWLKVGIRTYYSKETYDAPWSGGGRTGSNWMHQIARKWPSIPVYTPATPNAPKHYAEVSDIGFMEEGGRHIEDWDKPVLTGEVILTPLKGLTATMNYTYEADISNTSDHIKTVYYPQPSGTLSPIDYTYPNQFSRSALFNKHYIFNAFASYQTHVKKHNFKLLVGYVNELYDNLSFNGGNKNLYTDNVPSISTTYGKSPYISDSKNQLATEGVFGRFNYNYKEKYLLELTGRYDGTSRFLADTRWKFYPGVSAGWNIDKEIFWEDLNVDQYVNAFKLRASYGRLGDQGSIGSWYPFHPTLGTTQPTGTNWYFEDGREAQTSAPGLTNPYITWVTTSTLDFGADISAFDNRLAITFDWYKRSAKDYLGPARDFPAVLGTNPPQENSAAIETKGFELSVTWKGQIGDLSYTLRGNLSNYRGYVTEYPNDLGLLSNWRAGQRMGDIYGYTTVGYFQSDADVANAPDQSKIYSKWGPGDIQYADINGDGKIDWGKNTEEDMGDLSVIGNTTPQYQFGFYGSAQWKNLDFSFFIQGVGKRDFFPGSGLNYFWGITGNQWQSSVFQTQADRWTPSNPNGYFPKFYMSGENSKNLQTQTKYLQNAAYVRLKNIQIGYTLPSDILDVIGVKKFRVFVMADNILTLSPLSEHTNIDPELFFSDMKIYPMQRGYSVGVNVTF